MTSYPVPTRNALLVTPLLVALLLTTGPAKAEVARQGKLYPGGTLLEAPDVGVAFTVPEGWQALWPQGSEFLVMQPSDNQVMILAIVQEASEQEIRATMAAAIPLDSNVVLTPTSAVERRDGALEARYDVGGGQIPLKAWGGARASEHGVAVAFVLAAPADRLERHLPTARALIGSPDLFSAPAGAATATEDADQSGDRWDVYLKGRYLARYYTTTGYTDETHLWLCSDGTFIRSGAAGGFGGGASGAFQGGSSGRWQATGAGANGQLTLRFGDGSVAQHELFYDYDKDQLFVDGKRWLRGDNERCR